MRALPLLLLFLVGCGSGPEFELPPPSTTRTPSTLDATYYNRLNDVAFKLLDAHEGDIVFSPLAASHALAVLMNGASGESRDEAMELFGIQENTRDAFNESQRALINKVRGSDKLKFGVGVFAVWPVSIDKGYSEKMGRLYAADVRKLGGATIEGLRLLNDWSKERTGLPLGFVVKKEHQILAASTVYFEDRLPFQVTSKSAIVETNYWSDGDVDAVSVDLVSGLYSLVYLKFKGDSLELDGDMWRRVMGGLERRIVNLRLPVTSDGMLVDLLPAMRSTGVTSLFDEHCMLRSISIEYERGYSVSAVPQLCDLQIKDGSDVPIIDLPQDAHVPNFDAMKSPYVFAVVERSTGVVCALARFA